MTQLQVFRRASMALVEQRTFYKGEAILNLNAFQIFLFRPGGDPLVEVECSGSTCWLLYFVRPCDGGHFPAEVWLQLYKGRVRSTYSSQ